jgi:hypothetical protein
MGEGRHSTIDTMPGHRPVGTPRSVEHHVDIVTYGFSPDDRSPDIRPYLRPGESLVWVGRPDPSVRLNANDLSLVLAGILLLGVSIVFIAVTLTAGVPPWVAVLLLLVGLPLGAYALRMMHGRFIYKARRKVATAYGLTRDRAIVVVGPSRPRLGRRPGSPRTADSPVKHVPISIRRSRNGRVSVAFGGTDEEVEGMPWGPPPVAFYDVADGDDLLAALERVQREQRPSLADDACVAWALGAMEQMTHGLSL